jgi:hypothetical protein
MAGLLSAPDAKKRPSNPRNPFPLPNMRPHPINQNEIEAIAKTMKFLARMFTVFLALHSPDSTMANPRFIKNTRNAVNRTHTVSIPTAMLLFKSSSACCVTAAGVTSAADNPVTVTSKNSAGTIILISFFISPPKE